MENSEPLTATLKSKKSCKETLKLFLEGEEMQGCALRGREWRGV